MEGYIENKKKLYLAIHDFIDSSDEKFSMVLFQNLTKLIKTQKIEKDGKEIKQFLRIIKNIGDNHHHDHYFNEKMKQILLYFKKEIKRTLSNDEIFNLFENNKKIVLFLLKNGIIKMTESICNEMLSKIEPNGIYYWQFFSPEIENLIGEEKMNLVKKVFLKDDSNLFDNYEEKRHEGENDSHICSLIRQDSVEEFISFINRQKNSPSSLISPSVFETNPFLIKNKNITLIEYSAFIGSIQIFQYLLMNEIELTPSLWLYTIHSKNAELIHLLESNSFTTKSI